MSNILCPSCGKSNSSKVEICQYCGTALKRSATEPLDPIHTGDMPVKRKTSDLESTLPGWLRDARQASNEDGDIPGLHFPSSSPTSSAKSPPPAEPVKPEVPRKKAPASPLDFLAGLSQVGDEEEETPDWLKGLKDSIPGAAAPLQDQPTQAPGIPEAAQPAEQPAPASPDWGFGSDAESQMFNDASEQAEPAADETPDWLNALKAQDQSANATLVSKSAASKPAVNEPVSPVEMPPSGDLPDWLSALTGGNSSQPQPASPKPQSSDRLDAPDWLSGLGGDFTSDETYSPAESAPAADAQAPDWLTRMDEPSSDSGSPAQAQADSGPDLPAWLGGVSATAQPAADITPESAVTPADSELFDWLNITQDAPSTPAAAPAAPAEDMPDWVKDLQSSAPAAPPETPEASVGDIPDWMVGLQQDSAPASAVPAGQPADTMPDWMKDLQASSPVSAAPAAPLDAPLDSAEDMPDWMKDLQSPAPVTAIPAASSEAPTVPLEDIPDWMAGLQQDSTPVSAAPPETPAAVATPTDELPDWMKDLQQAAPPVSSVHMASSEAPTVPVEDIPDWMAGLQQDAAPVSAAPAETPAAIPTPADELPDWMKELQGSAPISAAPVTVPETPAAPADGMPDWMTGLQDSSPASVIPAETPAAILTPADELPDWMRAMQDSAPTSATPADSPIPAATPQPDAGLPSWLSEAMGEKPLIVEPASPKSSFDADAPVERARAESSESLPDWMAGLGAPGDVRQAAAAVPSETAEPAGLDLSGGDLPDWLGGLSAGAAALGENQSESNKPAEMGDVVFETLPAGNQSESPLLNSADEQSVDSIFAMDMPDWLSGFTPSDADKIAAQGDASQEDESLRPADLPSWVQAMRPMESVMAGAGDSQDDQKVENIGPLAGLRSVLPVQTGMPDAHISKPYALKLLANETQLAQAALLDNLLNSESTPQKAQKRATTLSIRPLRWLIAALLLLAILVPAVLGTRIFPVPPLPPDPSPAGAFISVVKGLSASSPVLVVVDYQPGFAGELETASGPVIAELASQNVPLAFISTSPVGPFMIDRLAKKYAPAYALNSHYVNLGYLPGGASGIKAFAEQPASTVGRDADLGNMWAAPALAGATVNAATSLSNFGAVIVLTDNPDTGRLWIEQASPSLKSSPMLMVVSAQAEPMIRPYMLSGQLGGMVAGLEGATLYENQTGETGKSGPRTYWDAFGMSMLAAELLILIGGAWGLITGLRSRRTATEQDEA